MRRAGSLVAALALLLAAGGCQGGDGSDAAEREVSTVDAGPIVAPPSGVQTRTLPVSELAAAGTAPASETRRVGQVLSQLGARPTRRGIVITLPERVLFDFNRANLRPDARATLGKLGEVLRFYRNAPVEIRGHTDSVGSHRYNLGLSLRRAQAVKDYLARRAGIAPGRLRARGLGETRPVAPNRRPGGSDNPVGRQKNRRVEVIVRGVKRPRR